MTRPATRRPALLIGIGLVLAVFVTVLLWILLVPDEAPTAEVASEPVAPVRTVVRAVDVAALEDASEAPDPELLRDAIRGELGVPSRNRVCRLCIAGVLDHGECKRCRGYADAGRLVYDIVDLNGRPFGSDISITALCPVANGRGELFGSSGSSGFIDLPAGTCTITPNRVTSGFRSVLVEPVEVVMVEDAETYQLLEHSDEPIGGVGVKLDLTEDGVWRVIDLIGSYAGDAIPVGAEILAIDGRTVGHRLERGRADPRERLPGPVGSEVEVRFGYESEAGWVEETVILKRHAIGRHEIGLGGYPG